MGGTITSLLETTIGQLFTALANMSGIFVGTGMVFAGLALTLTLLYGVYSWWTSGSIGDLVSNGVRILIILAPLLVLLHGWSGYMEKFMGLFTRELPAVVGFPSPTPEGVIGTSLDMLTKAVEFKEPTEAKDMDLWDRLAYFFSMSNFVSLILKLIAFTLTVLLAFGVIFAVTMPLAGLYIGAIFGPLLLPWMLWRPLSDMTARWTGFMIGNGMTFVVAVVILKAMSATLAAMTTQLQGMIASGFGMGLAGWLVTLIALFAIYIFATNLMLQANNMAQGMTGGATVGEGLFGKLAAAGAAGGMLGAGKLTAMAHGKAAGGAAKAAASAPGVAGKALDAGGKAVQGAGVAAAISNKSGATGVVSAGNAMRTAGGALASVQSGIDKAGSVLSKGKDRVKESSVYKALDKPIGR